MFKNYWTAVALCFSFQALAEVDFEEKKSRVEYLENLSKTATSMNIEAFRRELKYEELGLSLEKRAENEAKLLAEKIKLQVLNSYQEALKEHGNEDEAVEEVRSAIEKDLALIDGELQDELRELSFSALEHAQRNEVLVTDDLEGIQSKMLKGVKDRVEYLNHVPAPEPLAAQTEFKSQVTSAAHTDKNKLLAELVADKDNSGRVWTATSNLKSTQLVMAASKISLQVKVSFLGVAVEAGPSITFNRKFATNFEAVSEGMHSPINANGEFDFTKYDSLGRPVVKNGKAQKRKMNFLCESSISFSTEYSGAGGFSVMGVGGSVTAAKDYSNGAEIFSRRIDVPETIGGKKTTYKMLAELCHRDFLNTKITKSLTVSGSLNLMMKNIVSGLSFTHPKTKCATDSQCRLWFNDQAPLRKKKNVARCAENAKEKYLSCELRGVEGQACPVYDNRGRRVSGGAFEYQCDKGYVCKTIRPASFFFVAFAQCTKR